MYSEQVFLNRKNVLFKVVKTGYFYEYQLQLYIQLSEVGFKHNFCSYFSLEFQIKTDSEEYLCPCPLLEYMKKGIALIGHIISKIIRSKNLI